MSSEVAIVVRVPSGAMRIKAPVVSPDDIELAAYSKTYKLPVESKAKSIIFVKPSA